MVSSPPFLPSWVAHLHLLLTTRSTIVCCPGEMQGLLSHVLEALREKDNSPSLLTPRPVLSPAVGSKVLPGGHLWFTYATSWQVRGRRSALLQVEVQTTRFCMASVEVCPSVTNMSPSNIPDSWHSARPLLVLATMDINADRACGKAMDPDMALSSNSSPDDTMAPGDSAGQQLGSSYLYKVFRLKKREFLSHSVLYSPLVLVIKTCTTTT